MNRCSPGSKKTHSSLLLSKTIDGFLKFKIAEGLSQRTIESYERLLYQWLDHAGDQKVSNIKSSDLVDFLAWMRTEYQSRRWNGNSGPLSAKSLRNIYIALRAFFAWLDKEFGIVNPASSITSPKFPKQVMQTFTREEIEQLIKSCVYTREAQPSDRRKFVMRRPTANRDQALMK